MTATSTYRPLQTLTLYAMGVVVVLSCFFITAVPRAHASALTEQQINAIVNLLVSFNADSATIVNTEAALRGTGSANASTTTTSADTSTTSTNTSTASTTPPTLGDICAALTHTLAYGSRGDAVQALQSFLANHGYLSSGNATGFFGDLTRRALKRWQAEQGIASSGDEGSTGWGAFGPLSRAFVKRLCGNGSDRQVQNDHQGQNNQSSDNHSGDSGDNNGLNPADFFGTTTGTGSNPATSITNAPAPLCSIFATPASITQGDSATLSWSSSNAVGASLNGSGVSASGSKTITPTGSTSYTLLVFGRIGNGKCSTSITVLPPPPPPATTTATTTSETATTTTDTSTTTQSLASPVDMLAAVIATPFSIFTDSLTELFVQIGFGQ